MRPNFAQDAPPTSLEVGGFSYNIDSDYRTWLEVMRIMRSINFGDSSPKGLADIVAKTEELQKLIFGGVLVDENYSDTIAAISTFLAGYPSAPKNGTSDDSDPFKSPAFSFEYDLNEIIVAIYDQHRIDLSYRCKYFHWWEFLLLFHTVAGEHVITNLMQIRSYKGKDKELIRRRNANALPVEYTAEEQAELDAFNALFDTEE